MYVLHNGLAGALFDCFKDDSEICNFTNFSLVGRFLNDHLELLLVISDLDRGYQRSTIVQQRGHF